MSRSIRPQVGSPRELTEAFPWDTAPRYLLRDRDASYGERFQKGSGDGDHGGRYSATITLAECLRRAGHRLDSSRGPGSYTRDQRAPSAPRPVLVRRLLSPLADPFVARQIMPGCSPHPTAELRRGDRDCESRRASSALRTPRRLTCFRGLLHLQRSPSAWRALPSRAKSTWRIPTARTDPPDRGISSCVSSHPTRRSPESDTRWSFAQAQASISGSSCATRSASARRAGCRIARRPSWPRFWCSWALPDAGWSRFPHGTHSRVQPIASCV